MSSSIDKYFFLDHIKPIYLIQRVFTLVQNFQACIGTKWCCSSLLSAASPLLPPGPSVFILWLILHCLCFSLASNRSRRSDYHHESGLQNQNSKSLSTNAISFSEFPDPFPFLCLSFFLKDDKINFLSNMPSSKISHSDWHFPLLLPLTKTMTACLRQNTDCQHFISEKQCFFLQELVFLMKPAYGPFNRKLKRLQNTI